MADVMLSTAKRLRGAQGWYAGPGVEAEMNAALQQREETRRRLRAEPHDSNDSDDSNLRKAVKMVGMNLRSVRKAAVLSFFWAFVLTLETRVREGDQADLYKHLNTMDLQERRDRNSAYIKYYFVGRHSSEGC